MSTSLLYAMGKLFEAKQHLYILIPLYLSQWKVLYLASSMYIATNLMACHHYIHYILTY